MIAAPMFLLGTLANYTWAVPAHNWYTPLGEPNTSVEIGL